MASTQFIASLGMLLLLLPIMAKGDPLTDNICNLVECGKGSCFAAEDSRFGFRCECESGWKRTRLDNEENLEFLPCIIPQCSVEYACMPPLPSLPPPPPFNASFFDPCYWAYCGGGTCYNTTSYRQSCRCNPGYQNLFNVNSFPCYSDCAITNDCERLGIRVSNSTRPYNHATSNLPGIFHLMGIFLIPMAAALLK